MNSQLTYTEAFQELQQIVIDIENDKTSIDELSDKVKRAVSLIRICKEKLSSTGEDINLLLKELEE